MPPALRATGARLLLCLALVASTGAGAAVVPPGTVLAAKQEMTRNNGAEPESLDPQLIQSTNAFNVVCDLFEGLVAMDSHARIVPGVAESWTRPDATTWVFRLRPAQWSDGNPVTAQDFVYAWQRLVDPKSAAPLGAALGAYVLNGLEIAQGKRPPSALGVRAIDARTFEVKTPAPVPFLLWLLTDQQFSPVPRAVVEKFGRDWTKPGHLVGNGAFVLKDWQVNNRIVLEKNPRYWDAGHVLLTRVTHLPVEDTAADVKLYLSGENDFVSRLPAGTYEAMKARYPKDVHAGLVIALRFFSLNNEDPLLKDVRVRQALSMVIDRDVLAERITADGQRPVYGLVLQGSEGVDPVRYDWAGWPMERRVAEARRLLAEAGVKPGTTLKLVYNTSDYHKRMALFAAAEWKSRLGLSTELENMEYKVLVQRRQSGDYQVARNAWMPGFADISGLLMLVQCGHDANDTRVCDRSVDALVAQAGAATDPARRKALMTQAVRRAMDDYPLIPLLQISTTRLVKPYIGGYDDANDQDAFRSKDFYVIRH